ncbi:hypothetical protein BV898_18500 [Hypsibius exemplaris]|uniref:Uncharacterized protein n=1 Tax=Hypsibius exemplaris TaxID=2072580 RepID=A0A9X6RNW6_HYPEX|nr:hypothetical protein BV898_18500 [Hypsibius exemplaris]
MARHSSGQVASHAVGRLARRLDSPTELENNNDINVSSKPSIENEAMDDNKGTVENEAIEVASNNGSALESARSLRPTSEPKNVESSIGQSSLRVHRRPTFPVVNGV